MDKQTEMRNAAFCVVCLAAQLIFGSVAAVTFGVPIYLIEFFSVCVSCSRT